MAIAAEAPQQPERQPTVKVKGVCERCGKVATKHSRKGYTWRCECGFVNMGPGYHAQDRTPPEGTRRRIARRELAAERRAERGQAPETHEKPAPAPVRRKRSSAQTGGASPMAAPAAVETPSQGAPAPGRRGLFDRLMGYGEDE